MFKQFAVVILVSALVSVANDARASQGGIVQSGATTGKNEIEIQDRLVGATAEYVRPILPIGWGGPIAWGREITDETKEQMADAKRRAIDACQDYIEAYGREALDKFIEKYLAIVKNSLRANPSFYRNPRGQEQLIELTRIFLESSVEQAQSKVKAR
jgi:hypothetical protein